MNFSGPRSAFLRGSAFLPAVAFFLAPAPGGAQEPDSVVYTLDLDCSARGILNEGTESPYSILGISEDGSVFPFTRDEVDGIRLTEADCAAGIAPFTVTGAFEGSSRLLAIQIELLPGEQADDALYLDWVQLALDGPEVEDFMVWDVDGGLGWCLSSDPADRRGDWRGRVHDRTCYPCLQFSLVPIRGDDASIVDGNWKATARPGYSECFAID